MWINRFLVVAAVAVVALGAWLAVGSRGPETLDQATLAMIARDTQEDRKVRLAAVERLTESALLAEVAKDWRCESPINLAAINRLDDQAVLAEIAINADKKTNSPVCKAALEKLTDPTLLADVAKHSRDFSMRQHCCSRTARHPLVS